MNESNAILKYMNRVINLGEFICTLGPPFESSVDVDFIPFPTEIEPVQHVNKTSFAQPATLANIPNNNAINLQIVSIVTKEIFTQQTDLMTPIQNIYKNIKRKYHYDDGIVLFNCYGVISPMSTVASASLRDGDIVFILFLPAIFQKVQKYSDVVLEGSTFRLSNLLQENDPTFLRCIRIRYDIERDVDIYSLLSVLASECGSEFRTLTVTDETTKVALVPSIRCIETQSLNLVSEMIVPWRLVATSSLSTFVASATRSARGCVQCMRFLVPSSAESGVLDTLKQVEVGEDPSLVVVVNGKPCCWPSRLGLVAFYNKQEARNRALNKLLAENEELRTRARESDEELRARLEELGELQKRRSTLKNTHPMSSDTGEMILTSHARTSLKRTVGDLNTMAAQLMREDYYHRFWDASKTIISEVKVFEEEVMRLGYSCKNLKGAASYIGVQADKLQNDRDDMCDTLVKLSKLLYSCLQEIGSEDSIHNGNREGIRRNLPYKRGSFKQGYYRSNQLKRATHFKKGDLIDGS